jgi:hypothetical protein
MGVMMRTKVSSIGSKKQNSLEKTKKFNNKLDDKNFKKCFVQRTLFLNITIGIIIGLLLCSSVFSGMLSTNSVVSSQELWSNGDNVIVQSVYAQVDKAEEEEDQGAKVIDKKKEIDQTPEQQQREETTTTGGGQTPIGEE